VRSAALRLWLRLWKTAAPVSRIRKPLTLRIRPLAGDAAMRALTAWEPSWKTQAIAAVLADRQGTFIDVGANVGQTLLDFLSAPVRGSYVAFEPNLACAKHLSDLVSLNALEACLIIPAGLGDHAGIANLYSSSSEIDSGATVRESLRPGQAPTARTSCLLRFDDLRDALPKEPVALVKIDTEGSELEVLRGMKQMLRSEGAWVICEVLHRDVAADQQLYSKRLRGLMGLLRRIDYQAFHIRQDSVGATVRKLEPVSMFPDVSWHAGSERECDYLFVPSGQSRKAKELLGG
jgi:FkbM family methyltransferase